MKRSRTLRTAAGAITMTAVLTLAAACAENGGGVDSDPDPTTSTTFAVDPDARQGVTPGAFCSPEGAKGQTVTGRAMTCAKEGDDRARWRSP